MIDITKPPVVTPPTDPPDTGIGKGDSVNVTLRISKEEVRGMATIMGANAQT